MNYGVRHNLQMQRYGDVYLISEEPFAMFLIILL